MTIPNIRVHEYNMYIYNIISVYLYIQIGWVRIQEKLFKMNQNDNYDNKKKTIPWRLNGISQGCTGAMALHAAHARGINRGQPQMPRAMGTGISWGAWFYLGFYTQQAAEFLENWDFTL